MKSKFWLFFVTLFSLVVTSCDNDDDEPLSFSPPGVYSGTYTADQLPAQAPLPYSLFIEEDGTLVTEGKGANGMWLYSSGTWTLTGDTLRTSIVTINYPNVNVHQTQKFVFTKSTGQLSNGTWKDGAGGSDYTGVYHNMTRND